MADRMRDGTTVEDPRLGRIPLFDPRSRGWPIRPMVSGRPHRAYTWRLQPPALDQGPVGACVAYMIAHQALMRPAEVPPRLLDRATILGWYCRAQRDDPWPGTDAVCSGHGGAQDPHYGGTAVLAGLKVGRAAGLYRTFRWAFGVDDALLGVGYNGPALAGTWWRAGMMRPDSSGKITWTGSKVGGHAYVWCSVDGDGLDGRVRIVNSWGPGWGDHGHAWMTARDAAAALEDQGEAAFVQRRTSNPPGLR